MKKITAEETRAVAVEKARAAEQEKARLAAEGAKQAEQARAAAAAKAAEDARIAAEKAKQIEQDKAAAAEKARLAEQEKVRLAAEKARQVEQEKAAAAEQARVAAEKTAAEKKEQLAALPAPAQKPEGQPQVDLPRALQAELRRVGCNSGSVDGNWNASSQRALDLFNKHAGTKLDVRTASADALDAVKGKSGRICPLMCEHGFRADGDRCAKITCRAGFRINDDNECEKVQEKKPVAAREEGKPQRDIERKKSESAPAKPQATGQIICDTRGCRPVAKGCRIEQPKTWGSSGGPGSYVNEVCQ